MDIKIKDLINNFAVSSVLNRDLKQFGKNNIFDGNGETCWSSDEGVPQWMKINFKNEVIITGISIQFQGGFAGKECLFKNESNGDQESFYPEDLNSLQIFTLSKSLKGKRFTIMFESSTDFFGRIVIYNVLFNLIHEES